MGATRMTGIPRGIKLGIKLPLDLEEQIRTVSMQQRLSLNDTIASLLASSMGHDPSAYGLTPITAAPARKPAEKARRTRNA